MNPESLQAAFPEAQFMLKCTFCPEESDGTLSVEVEEGQYAPFPICESCLQENISKLNMVNNPESEAE